MVGDRGKDWCCVGAAQESVLSAWCLSILSIRAADHARPSSTPDNTEIPEKRGPGPDRAEPPAPSCWGHTLSAPPRAMPHITAQTLHGDLLWGGGQSVLTPTP